MTKTANLNLTVLKAAVQVVSNERPNMNGVCVEVSATWVNYIATDGHILFATQDPSSSDNTLLGSFIIPADVIKTVKLGKRGEQYASIHLEADDSVPGQLTLKNYYTGQSYGFQPIESDYPNWRGVIPLKFSGLTYNQPGCAVAQCTDSNCARHDKQYFGYNPNLLAKLWKAFELIGYAKPTLTPNDSGAGLVRYGYANAAFGLIMPMRVDTQADKAPDWVNVKSSEQVEEKAA